MFWTACDDDGIAQKRFKLRQADQTSDALDHVCAKVDSEAEPENTVDFRRRLQALLRFFQTFGPLVTSMAFTKLVKRVLAVFNSDEKLIIKDFQWMNCVLFLSMARNWILVCSESIRIWRLWNASLWAAVVPHNWK